RSGPLRAREAGLMTRGRTVGQMLERGRSGPANRQPTESRLWASSRADSQPRWYAAHPTPPESANFVRSTSPDRIRRDSRPVRPSHGAATPLVGDRDQNHVLTNAQISSYSSAHATEDRRARSPGSLHPGGERRARRARDPGGARLSAGEGDPRS